jgi:hypothetical protein
VSSTNGFKSVLKVYPADFSITIRQESMPGAVIQIMCQLRPVSFFEVIDFSFQGLFVANIWLDLECDREVV